MELSQRIAAIRKEMKLSQDKFGELVNMSQRSVAAWESGERLPSYPVLIELADKLNVSVDYLLGRTEEKQKEPAAAGSELDNQLITLLQDLPENQTQRVKDFVAGLKAAREP